MRHKLATVGLSYFVGLFCASFFILNQPAYIGFIISFILIIPVPILIAIKRPFPVMILVSISVAFAVFGWYEVSYNYPVNQIGDNTAVREIKGVVLEKGQINNDNTSYLVEAEIDGIKTKISFYGTDIEAEYGDTMIFSAVLFLPEDSTVFAENSYYFTRKIGLKAAIKSEIKVIPSDTKTAVYYINQYSDYMREKIMTEFPDDTGGLLTGIFLGDKSQMSSSLKSSVKLTGISHMAAVSGFNLTLVVHIMMLLLGSIGLKNKRYLKLILIVVLILTFMVFFKMSASVLRSGTMLIIFYGAEFFRRKTDTMNSVGLSCLIILIFNPCACRDIGFLLSIAGTVGVGVVGPIISDKVNGKFNLKKPAKGIVEAVIESSSAILCTLPFSALFFGGISLVSLIANLILAPLFTAVVLLVTLFAITGGAVDLLLHGAGVFSKLMVWITEILGDVRYAYLSLEYDFIIVWLCLSITFIFIITVFFRSVKFSSISVMASVISLIIMISVSNFQSRDTITIETYTDGQDGCMIFSGNNECKIICTSDSGRIADKINEYCNEKWLYNIDTIYFCTLENNGLSYYNEQLSEFEIEKIYMPEEGQKIALEYGLFENSIALPAEQAKDTGSMDKIHIVYQDNAALCNVNGILFSAVSVKNFTDNIDSNVILCYDYNKSIINPKDNTLLLLTDKKQNGGKNSVNLYNEKIRFYVDNDGRILSKGALK